MENEERRLSLSCGERIRHSTQLAFLSYLKLLEVNARFIFAPANVPKAKEDI